MKEWKIWVSEVVDNNKLRWLNSRQPHHQQWGAQQQQHTHLASSKIPRHSFPHFCQSSFLLLEGFFFMLLERLTSSQKYARTRQRKREKIINNSDGEHDERVVFCDVAREMTCRIIKELETFSTPFIFPNAVHSTKNHRTSTQGVVCWWVECVSLSLHEPKLPALNSRRKCHGNLFQEILSPHSLAIKQNVAWHQTSMPKEWREKRERGRMK